MYKTILVPLDGSQVAEAILPHATQLAALSGGTVIFVEILELPHMINLPDNEDYDALPRLSVSDAQAMVRQAQEYLAGQVSALEAQGIKGRWRVEFGPVVASIMRVAQEENASLIAMASHGRGGLSDVYYGSVAAGVLQRIDRPLLIVRGQK